MSSTRLDNLLGDFLRTRRQHVTPELVGIAVEPGRRVTGLRREEVAALAGVSPDYYLRLEQGKDRRPSEQVIRGLSRALLLDGDGQSYLLKLAQQRAHLRTVAKGEEISAAVYQLLAQWPHTPAYITDGNQNILATNELASRIAPGLFVSGRNLLLAAFDDYAEFLVGTPSAEGSDAQQAWLESLRALTAAFRFNGDADDPSFREVLGTLTARHLAFRTIWALHEARPQLSGINSVEIPEFGWANFHWQTLDLPHPANHFLTIFAAHGSRARQAVAQLAAAPDPSDYGSVLEALPEVAARRSNA